MMAAAAPETGWRHDEGIFKTTLERLGLKRLTKQVREHLEPILDLAKGEYGPDDRG